jgi:hypothetical protein
MAFTSAGTVPDGMACTRNRCLLHHPRARVHREAGLVSYGQLNLHIQYGSVATAMAEPSL